MGSRKPSEISLEDQDEDVRIAVRALGDMRNGGGTHSFARSDSFAATPPLTMASSSNTPFSISPSMSTEMLAEHVESPDFVSRVSHLPLVHTALKAYEKGKASSSVVKYGAEMVESSVMTISKPVINRLPVDVKRLDEFASRQLDRLDRYRRPSFGPTDSQNSVPTRAQLTLEHDFPYDDEDDKRKRGRSIVLDDVTPVSTSRESSMVRDDVLVSSVSSTRSSRLAESDMRAGDKIPSWLEGTSQRRTSPGSRDNSPHAEDRRSRSEDSGGGTGNHADSGVPEGQQQVVQRSRWQAVLLEAGGLSAALSDESMRRLKYCLQWLQYATAHIDAQILILRDFIATLQPLPPHSSSPSRSISNSPQSHSSSSSRSISQERMYKLTSVRKDVVHTVRQVVDVVSKYAGGALPEPARSHVRMFILKLPQRWAAAASATSSPNLGGGAPTPAIAALVSSEGSSEVDRERGRELESVVTAAATGGAGTSSISRRAGRRQAWRERGTGSAADINNGSRSMTTSPASSRATSPAASPRVVQHPRLHAHPRHAHSRNSSAGESAVVAGGAGSEVTAGAAIVAAQRILTLATESLDMMRGVTGVVKDSLDRADAWVGRLRVVGMRSGQNPEDEQTTAVGERPSLVEGRQLPPLVPSGSNTPTTTTTTNTGLGPYTYRNPSASSSSPPSAALLTGQSKSWEHASDVAPGSPEVLRMDSMVLSSACPTPKSTSTALPDDEDRSSKMDVDESS